MVRRISVPLLLFVTSIAVAVAAPAGLNDEVTGQSRPQGGISSFGDIICPAGTVRAGRRVRNVAACNRPFGVGPQPAGQATRNKK
jgi:hypothetical protein